MKVKVGCDIQYLPKFKEAVEKRGQTFLQNLFSAQELANNDKIQSLSGLFAVKEAIIKAVGLEPGSWKRIEIIKRDNGKPDAVIDNLDLNVASCDISISHDQDYTMAIASFLIYEITN
jgi:phosphopantetheine--protein transferase-like protein